MTPDDLAQLLDDNERVAALEAFRVERARSLDAWLERSHGHIFAIPGFRGMTFPDARRKLHVRMATNDGAQAVMRLLERAQADGINVDPDHVSIEVTRAACHQLLFRFMHDIGQPTAEA